MNRIDRHLLFLYGTLKRGRENHHLVNGQEYAGPARTVGGYALYHLDGYPGLVAEASAPGGITGELWWVDTAALHALDAFEGVAEGLYERVPVRLAEPRRHPRADTYLYRRSVAGYPRLGDRW
jgi:gamma-glutamylaminecyclotransferase